MRVGLIGCGGVSQPHISHIFGEDLRLGSLSLSVSTKLYLQAFSVHGTDVTVQADLTKGTVATFTRSRPWRKLRNIEHGLQLLCNSVRNRLGRGIPDQRILIERCYESLLKGTAPSVSAENGRAAITVLGLIWAELALTAPSRQNGNEP